MIFGIQSIRLCCDASLIASNGILIIGFFPHWHCQLALTLRITFAIYLHWILLLMLICTLPYTITSLRIVQGKLHYFLIAISLEMQFILHSLGLKWWINWISYGNVECMSLWIIFNEHAFVWSHIHIVWIELYIFAIESKMFSCNRFCEGYLKCAYSILNKHYHDCCKFPD